VISSWSFILQLYSCSYTSQCFGKKCHLLGKCLH